MYQTTVRLKHTEPVNLLVNDIDAFTQSLNKSELLWIDNGNKFVYIPPSEIALIVGQKIEQVTDTQAIPQSCDSKQENGQNNDWVQGYCKHQAQTEKNESPFRAD